MYAMSCVFTALCAVVLPIAVTVALCVRKKKIWLPILLGTLTFVAFQVVARTLLNQVLLPNLEWFKTMVDFKPVLYALYIGGTTALLEVGGSYIVISLFLKKHRKILDGIAFGVGYGGIEAIFLAVISAFLLLSTTEKVAANTIFADGVISLSNQILQTALSVMVLKSVREKKYFWLILAFLINTSIGFGTKLATNSIGTWAIVTMMLFVAAIMAWFVVKEYKKKTEI